MDQSQIFSLAKSAGLSDANAKVAAAIAMAESGGNPNDHNTTPPDDSYGLWQINMFVGVDPHTGKHVNLGPPRRAVYRLSSNSDLFDPATNARVMSAISSNGRNFNAWTTYTSEKYKQFLGNTVTDTSGGKSIGSQLADATGLSDVKAVIDLASRTATTLTKTSAWVSNPANWVRIAYVVVGGAAILLGITTIAKESSAGKATIKAAGHVTAAAKKTATTAAKVAAV